MLSLQVQPWTKNSELSPSPQAVMCSLVPSSEVTSMCSSSRSSAFRSPSTSFLSKSRTLHMAGRNTGAASLALRSYASLRASSLSVLLIEYLQRGDRIILFKGTAACTSGLTAAPGHPASSALQASSVAARLNWQSFLPHARHCTFRGTSSATTAAEETDLDGIIRKLSVSRTPRAAASSARNTTDWPLMSKSQDPGLILELASPPAAH